VSERWGIESVILLKELLTKPGNFYVLDWGRPRDVWQPQKGIKYIIHLQSEGDTSNEATSEWREKNWTFGPPPKITIARIRRTLAATSLRHSFEAKLIETKLDI
jgi:hypothetical protein